MADAPRSNVHDTWLSKSLSWLLRHGAVKENLHISPEGYVTLDQILQHRTFLGKCSILDIQRVVANNLKQRFTLREDPHTHALEIKANQGHSICHISDDGLTPILEIKVKGLSRMKRRHIHLAKGILQDQSVISGLRQNVEIYIFIELDKALTEGLKFFESANGVILTSGDEGFLLPKYFLKVIRVDTGYPHCTQQEDLERAFASHGARVERMTARDAVLRCSDTAAAAEAVQSRACVYGTMLAVRPYTGALPAQPQQPKREFPRSKQKDVIVEPRSIDLSGDFHSQLDAVLARVRLTQEEVQKLVRLYADLELALGSLWPGCVCLPFGSITTGLGIKTSDADCFVEIPPRHRHPQHNYVNKAKRVLQQFPSTFAELLSIPRANTPIVKLHHLPTSTNCDLSFKSVLGVRNSRLIAALLHARPALLPAAVLLKYWAKVHDICGSGKLSNYALTMLFLFYLQQPPRALLPAVAALQQDRTQDYMVDFWNTGFSSDHRLFPAPPEPYPIADLLGGFFQYYGSFDFDRLVVCPYLGRPVEKQAFKDTVGLPAEFGLYKKNVIGENTYPLKHTTSLCVQDPFEQCHNVAGGVGQRMAADLRAYCQFAAAAYEKERRNECRGFLKVILLEKPHIVRSRAHPEFRINLFSKTITALPEDEWKTRVRATVFNIFETMLQLTLTKAEDEPDTSKPDATKPDSTKPNSTKPHSTKPEATKPEAIKPEANKPETTKPEPTSKKERERYLTTITRAIWRRKQFAKLHRRQTLPLIEQESRITQEVLRVDRTELALQLNLVLSFRTAPRNVVVSVRLKTGEPDTFKEFGRFYLSSVQYWLTELLKPTGAGPREAPSTDANNVDVPDDPDSEDSEETEEIKSPRNEVCKEGAEEDASNCLSSSLSVLTTDG